VGGSAKADRDKGAAAGASDDEAAADAALEDEAADAAAAASTADLHINASPGGKPPFDRATVAADRADAEEEGCEAAPDRRPTGGTLNDDPPTVNRGIRSG